MIKYKQTNTRRQTPWIDKQIVEKLRQKYMQNPPEGMTSEMVKRMSDNDLLDMDYFLNEEFDDDDVGEEGFYIF